MRRRRILLLLAGVGVVVSTLAATAFMGGYRLNLTPREPLGLRRRVSASGRDRLSGVFVRPTMDVPSRREGADMDNAVIAWQMGYFEGVAVFRYGRRIPGRRKPLGLKRSTLKIPEAFIRQDRAVRAARGGVQTFPSGWRRPIRRQPSDQLAGARDVCPGASVLKVSGLSRTVSNPRLGIRD
jgi:hypothetical protein